MKKSKKIKIEKSTRSKADREQRRKERVSNLIALRKKDGVPFCRECGREISQLKPKHFRAKKKIVSVFKHPKGGFVAWRCKEEVEKQLGVELQPVKKVA